MALFNSFNLEKPCLQVIEVAVLVEVDDKDFKRLCHAVDVNYR